LGYAEENGHGRPEAPSTPADRFALAAGAASFASGAAPRLGAPSASDLLHIYTVHIYSFLVLAPIRTSRTAVATVRDTHSSLVGIHHGHSYSPSAAWARLSAAWLRKQMHYCASRSAKYAGITLSLPSLPRADCERIYPTDRGGVFPSPVFSTLSDPNIGRRKYSQPFPAGACARCFDRATPLLRSSFPSLAWHPADHAYSVALPSLRYITYGPEV
jgi:hypothetical protein